MIRFQSCLLLFFFVISTSLNSQVFRVSDFTKINPNKENGELLVQELEAMFLRKNLEPYDISEDFEYTELSIDKNDLNNCKKDENRKLRGTWIGPAVLKSSKSKLNSTDIGYKYYREGRFIISKWALDYKLDDATAITWVEVRWSKKVDNDNCKNIPVPLGYKNWNTYVSLQLNNANERERFKEDVKRLEYEDTMKEIYGDRFISSYKWEKDGIKIGFNLYSGSNQITIHYEMSEWNKLAKSLK